MGKMRKMGRMGKMRKFGISEEILSKFLIKITFLPYIITRYAYGISLLPSHTQPEEYGKRWCLRTAHKSIKLTISRRLCQSRITDCSVGLPCQSNEAECSVMKRERNEPP